MTKRYHDPGDWIQSPTGEYVRYEDYAKAIGRITVLEAALREALEDDDTGGGLTDSTIDKIAALLTSETEVKVRCTCKHDTSNGSAHANECPLEIAAMGIRTLSDGVLKE